MIYPKFLHNNSTIGITAPSDGKIDKLDLIRLDNAYNKLKELGYNITETKSVRNSINGRSSDSQTRALELEELYNNNDVDIIISASGGEFMMEVLPYIDYKILKNNPKWFCGYSDNTTLGFILPTIYDIASIYSDNISAFGMNRWHQSIKNYLNILTGNIVSQKSFNKYQSSYQEYITGLESYKLDKNVSWTNLTGQKEIKIEGRLIGGCLDVLLTIVGTKYDNVNKFINKYKDEGIVWFLESCDLSSEQLIRGLWQLKEAGWFKYTKGFIFGRTITKKTYTNTSYEEAIITSLKELNVPIIIDADFGHTSPRITIINGCYSKITSKNGKGEIKQVLK
ncbi:MAG: LD-carboxypeptidase [Bacilli bacterium]|nr:LD-carboxypeptidase [Bacilli bacterium]MBR3162409.1 LD-carboxypeptidase [Bacilli bacterium]